MPDHRCGDPYCFGLCRTGATWPDAAPRSLALSFSLPAVMQTLIRRNVITVDPARAYECCGIPRDEDGFCAYKPRHPVYVDVTGRDHLPDVSAPSDGEST